MNRIWPKRWEDYQLLDFGGEKRLELWNGVKLIRPDIHARGEEQHPGLWRDVHAEFLPKGKQSGEWEIRKPLPKDWFVGYQVNDVKLRFVLKLTQFKHVGLFPEQAANWDWMTRQLASQGDANKVLNLFAYTGGASLVAKACGADVTHVDSIKQVVSWSRESMEKSGLKDIRWTVEDALKFAQRELKRGNKYEGIIMDPPSFGRGPKGERWKLQDLLPKLLDAASKLLVSGGWLILNVYSGMSIPELKEETSLCFKNAKVNVDLLSIFSENQKCLDTGIVLKLIAK